MAADDAAPLSVGCSTPAWIYHLSLHARTIKTLLPTMMQIELDLQVSGTQQGSQGWQQQLHDLPGKVQVLIGSINGPQRINDKACHARSPLHNPSVPLKNQHGHAKKDARRLQMQLQ